MGHLHRRGVGRRQPGNGLFQLRLPGGHLGLGLTHIVLGRVQGRLGPLHHGVLGRDFASGGIQIGCGRPLSGHGMVQLLGADGIAPGHFLIAFQIQGGLLIFGFHGHRFGLGLVQRGLGKSHLRLSFTFLALGRGRQSPGVLHHGLGRRHGRLGLIQAGCGGDGGQVDIDVPGAVRSLVRAQ